MPGLMSTTTWPSSWTSGTVTSRLAGGSRTAKKAQQQMSEAEQKALLRTLRERKTRQLIELAEAESQRLDRWIRYHYRVLPTDPRYERLTDDEIALEYYSFLFLEGSQRCTNCGRLASGRFCPFCGEELYSWLTKQCINPKCLRRGIQEWRYCPDCGSEMEPRLATRAEEREWLGRDEPDEEE